MIFIKKNEKPDFFNIPDNIWDKETQAAINHYSNPYEKAFEFKEYGDSRVKNALKAIFKDKCAYCETYYGAVYDGDIEHFRPKGKVSEKNPKTPGYYWLANDWDNLLLSCQHCNQRRNHEIYVLDSDSVHGSLGKLDQFPIKNESLRASSHTHDISEEERLLINPCIENPEEYFEYNMEEGVITSNELPDKKEMALKSIEVYALQRSLLVKSRKRVLIKVKNQIQNLIASKTKEQFQEEFATLKEFGKPDSEYAGMCRFVIKKYLTEYGYL